MEGNRTDGGGFGIPTPSDEILSIVPHSQPEHAIAPSGPQSLRASVALPSSPPSINHDSDDLQRVLRSELVYTSSSITPFLPWDVPRRIFTPAAVIHAIYNDSTTEAIFDACEDCRANICDLICPSSLPEDRPNEQSFGKCSRLFSILLCMQKPAAILNFINEGLEDTDLPFELHRNKGCVKLQLQGKSIEAFRKWTVVEVESFGAYQWSVLSPFFSRPSSITKEVFHYQMDRRIPLPFIESEELNDDHSETNYGAYGTVFKARIHPAHFDFKRSEDEDTWFAIKRLNSPHERVFKKETDPLTKFSIDSHKHLIQLLATYHQNGHYYLIFPLANENLRGFWNNNPNPVSGPTLARWIAEQCHGLAAGLSNIHVYPTSQQHHEYLPAPILSSGQKRYGRHSDIKPENILWFQDCSSKESFRGTLKISDFGFAQFNSRHSRSNLPPTSPGTPTYRPPECDFDRHLISRSFDLWTLGCVYLELITWYLKGSNAVVDEFPNLRLAERENPTLEYREDKFFKITHSTAYVKDSVLQWMDSLHEDPKCTEHLHDFLKLIRISLIVPDPIKRADCASIVSKLDGLLKRCCQDIEYCSVGVPLSGVPPNPHPYVYDPQGRNMLQSPRSTPDSTSLSSSRLSRKRSFSGDQAQSNKRSRS